MRNVFFSTAVACFLTAALISCGNTDTATTTESSADTTNTSGMTTAPEGQAASSGIDSTKNIVQNAQASPDHTTLVQAVLAAGLADTLASAGPYTVFAPTNAAFAQLPAGAIDNLLQPANKAQLQQVLTYHVVPGNLRAKDLRDGQKLRTVQGQQLTVRMRDGMVMIDSARVSMPDIVSSNGVIHVIDGVMMPKK